MGRVKVAIWLRFLRRLAVGLVLIYVGVVLALGGTPPAQLVLNSLSVVWFVAVVVVTICCPIRTFWLEVAATNVAFTVVLAELFLQAWATAMGTSPLIQENLDAYRLIAGHDYGAGLYGNRLGYPGPELAAEKQPGVLRIAAVGDSFAVGPAVPFADNFLARLADELPGSEVGNFGVCGAGPPEYREVLQRDVWAVQPDLVLVAIFIGNDITESLPRPRRLDPRHHALYLFCQRGWKLARAKWQIATEPNTGSDHQERQQEPPDRLAAPPLSPAIFREVEARRLAVCLKQTAPSMARKWRNALGDLDAIVRACHSRNAAVAVVLIPDEFQVNPAVLENALADAGFCRDEVDLDGPQRRLQAFFDEREVPCLDLLPAFRTAPNTYAPCDTHWNVAGNRLAAREIGTWLAPQSEVRRRVSQTRILIAN